LPYPEVRERLLAVYEDSEEVEWLVQVGAFVRDRWLAEENARGDAQILDEQAHWDLWDECTEGGLRDLQYKAVKDLKAYRAKSLAAFLQEYVPRRLQPIAWAVNGLSWICLQAWRGFVSGIGLVILGLLLAWLQPQIVKTVRGAVDKMLPEGTSPAAPVGNQAPTAIPAAPTAADKASAPLPAAALSAP
jgi:hypothetical protein